MTRLPTRFLTILIVAVAAGLPSCSGCYGAESSPLVASMKDTRFVVAAHMRASREMQLSGEPFAELLGYNLMGFSRTSKTTDQYLDPQSNTWRTDPLGYGLAVESYEYSKQPMNNLSFESGAGLSLMFGPVLNPDQVTGDGAYTLLSNRFQQFAVEANAAGAPGKALVVSPAPSDNPLNPYGWPGVWPIFAEFESFDPAIAPAPGAVPSCTLGAGMGSSGSSSVGGPGAFAYGTGPGPTVNAVADYECDYNSLHLTDRETQVSKILRPDAMGEAVWKQGLWVINYWQTMQDTQGNAIIQVAPEDLPLVGQPGNTVVGQYPDPTDPTGLRLISGSPGVFLGDIPMEGWQGLTMMEEIDNKAALLLGTLLCNDQAALEGAGSIAVADGYDYRSPLLYFPAAVAVSEEATAPSQITANKYFPRPAAFSLVDGSSSLAGLSGLLGGFGEAFAFTDSHNSQVGGSVPFLATFDGDPFPADDGEPDGEATLHDRALGILKIAAVDLDRLHWNAASAVLVDSAKISGGQISQGTTVTTTTLVEAILALRNAYRGLNGSLQLYSNDTPDTQNAASALDTASISGAPYAGPLSAHLLTLLTAEANFLRDHLIVKGAVANSFDLATGGADTSATTVDSEAGAMRALLEASLATSDESYLQAALAVEADLEARFWVEDVRLYRTTAGSDTVFQYTPLRYGLLTGALRQYYKLWASAPGRSAEGEKILGRIKRLMKLLLNGWDDVNQDDHIQYPDECLWAGLQLGERALTGELGLPGDKGDRDQDCVREISHMGLPAALGAELDVERH